MIWVMPVNPVRDAVGQQRVSSYINPYFEQSWSVFAPTPRRGGENVVIRAFIGDPTKKNGGTVTEWHDITADADARTKYLVNPSRFHSATRRLGGNVNNAMAAFAIPQRQVVAANFYQTSRTKIGPLLQKGNRAGPRGEANIVGYVQTDEMLTRFGTMYATARWGKGVSMVQFRIGHRSVPNYAERNEVDFSDVPFTYYLVGWRKAMTADKEAQAAFDDYVDRVPVKKTTKDGTKP